MTHPTQPAAMVPAMILALEANFGSLDAWRADFVAKVEHGPEQGPEQEQMQLHFQPHDGALVNRRVGHTPSTANTDAVLVSLDLAGLSPAAIEAAVANIDWAAAYTTYQHAVHKSTQALAAQHADVPAALLLDVRRAGVFAQAETLLPGATWRDPARVADWAAELPRDRPVLVYCIYGHEVGRATALRLYAAGVQARFLEGGIDGWLAAGRPVQAKTKP